MSRSPRTPDLPLELISQIIRCLPWNASCQSTFYATCLLSRSWYSASIQALYHRPHITPNNFTRFVRTVCPSVNAHVKKSDLACYVRWLDMSNLVHESTRSLTARLLSRVKGALEAFIAPQASFSVNCLAALSKCRHLHHLDLSWVSQAIPHTTLFRICSALPLLRTLRCPRSTAPTCPSLEACGVIGWPPHLQTLVLSGNFVNAFLMLSHLWPRSLTDLTLDSCPLVDSRGVIALLGYVGLQLRYLSLGSANSRTDMPALGTILGSCPSLTRLRIPAESLREGTSVEDMTFIQNGSLGSQSPDQRLERLDIIHRPSAWRHFDFAADILLLLNRGFLPRLRRIGVSENLLRTFQDGEYVPKVVAVLEERGQQLGFADDAGVWSISE